MWLFWCISHIGRFANPSGKVLLKFQKDKVLSITPFIPLWFYLLVSIDCLKPNAILTFHFGHRLNDSKHLASSSRLLHEMCKLPWVPHCLIIHLSNTGRILPLHWNDVDRLKVNKHQIGSYHMSGPNFAVSVAPWTARSSLSCPGNSFLLLCFPDLPGTLSILFLFFFRCVVLRRCYTCVFNL